ncbi:hypothetical protein [Gracilimonas mengyeensis]|uniref:Outer membrane protein beta-barrel domain-containing protein n=1 Tax=Gracilimonas mengyeensis TaxID=1302730 RepID=A0A521CQU6_9BACT|nr:hypothetical protein [Gracilimonas mengyeensis]SMO61822.1 hypothetical protein SAMN06265219_10678 [Gracilimonas mengyeensis]
MKIIILSILSFIFILPAEVHAQMFSVDDENRRQANPFSPYVRGGVRIIDFAYQGNASTTSGIPADRFAFTGTAAHLGFESGGFSLSASLGNNATGIDDVKYFDLNLNFSNAFFLIREPRFAAGFPIQLGSKLTNVNRDDINDNFSQTNLSIGGGGILSVYVPQRFSITANFMPHYGFSTARGGLFGGSVFSLTGEARVNFLNLIFGRNVSLGYNYDFDSYNIDGEDLDYDFTGHTITLGISL